jgi:hypothetical protein
MPVRFACGRLTLRIPCAILMTAPRLSHAQRPYLHGRRLLEERRLSGARYSSGHQVGRPLRSRPQSHSAAPAPRRPLIVGLFVDKAHRKSCSAIAASSRRPETRATVAVTQCAFRRVRGSVGGANRGGVDFGVAMAYPRNVGILALEVYFPRSYVSQTELGTASVPVAFRGALYGFVRVRRVIGVGASIVLSPLSHGSTFFFRRRACGSWRRRNGIVGAGASSAFSASASAKTGRCSDGGSLVRREI